MRRLIFALSAVAFLAGAGFAFANPMALTTEGHLYKVSVAEEGLVLIHSGPEMETTEAVVPQTLGLGLDGVTLVIDEKTETPFILWAETTDELSAVRLAALVDGSWLGPVVLAGEDGTTLTNPHALIHGTADPIDLTDDGETVYLETTFLHTVWWRHDNVTALGHAVYFPIPLDVDGFPLVHEAPIYDLENLLPFGIPCDDNPDVAGLASARLLIGAKGTPQIFAPDFADCVFHLLDIEYEIEEADAPEDTVKRRRSIPVFRVGEVKMAIPPDIDLEASKMLLGSDNSVLIYWDGLENVEWIRSDAFGWTGVKNVPLDGDIDHETAVELLRGLAR